MAETNGDGRLLVRIDERTQAILKAMEALQEKQPDQDEKIEENTTRSGKNKTAIYYLKWAIGIIISTGIGVALAG